MADVQSQVAPATTAAPAVTATPAPPQDAQASTNNNPGDSTLPPAPAQGSATKKKTRRGTRGARRNRKGHWRPYSELTWEERRDLELRDAAKYDQPEETQEVLVEQPRRKRAKRRGASSTHKHGDQTRTDGEGNNSKSGKRKSGPTTETMLVPAAPRLTAGVIMEEREARADAAIFDPEALENDELDFEQMLQDRHSDGSTTEDEFDEELTNTLFEDLEGLSRQELMARIVDQDTQIARLKQRVAQLATRRSPDSMDSTS
ncbi:uncharacterized protein MONBRDRAFT_36988 [Monosiga brevicollis MX1]|uniref:Uncharacterized protein n=1 Tax=Monosiga brevicollis TaxID=81824 RepID=A9UYV1_MONBE|nr:uncharacterized protein MONBRDRAFT_36988 [Monosiga brevicollis MX1]EDQ89524.1 predicted protein [Monosiga brevicollis MX1]|eukprot:XP_001745553.1 hypothetical protein [Monosiga brevicollis MX1]